MALTTTQVNQAFLGLLGRPATGAEAAKFAGQLDAATLAQTLLTDASFKNELSVETLSFKTVDLLNTDPAAFVESLYTALLGRASDAEGKAFWLSVAGATPNRADVVSQFIAAVKAQEGTADANAFATIQAEDKALASAWVESLYNNLAGRASDAEGLDFWTNAIVSFTMTPAQVAASFAAALALQGNTTEDGQNFAAKLGVADNFTANFKDFNNLLTANEKATSLNSLVTMMNGVNKDSQVEQYTEEITKFSGEYQNIKAIQFTTKDDDNLGVDPETGEPNTTSGVNFTGTYNLTDETKGTIQSSDSVTGNENYKTDTLTINVIGYNKDDNTKQTLDLDTSLPSVTSVERLNINNGAAEVKGTLSGFDYITVNGTGKFNITNATASDTTVGLGTVVLSSGASKEGESNIFVTNEKIGSFKSTNGNDNVTLGDVSKSVETGAGDDTLIIGALSANATVNTGAGKDKITINGKIDTNAKINAGAGDDTITIKVVENYKKNSDGSYAEDAKGVNIINPSIEIDAGTGTADLLDLSTAADANKEFYGIKSIKGVESLKVGNGTALMASAVSGQNLELSGTNLVLNASGSTSIDLAKFKKATDQSTTVTIDKVKSGTITLENTANNTTAIKETIVLSKDADKVSIKNFETANDVLSIEGASNSGKALKDISASFAASISKDTIYGTSISKPSAGTDYSKVSNARDLNKTLNLTTAKGEQVNKLSLAEGDSFFIIASDAADVGGKDTGTATKVYKATVGKDGTVATVTLMANVSTSNKGVIDPIGPDVGSDNETLAALPLTYASGIPLNLSVDTYNTASGVTTAAALAVNNVSGALTIKGTNDNTKTVEAALATGGSVVKAGTANVTVDLNIGGEYKDAAAAATNPVGWYTTTTAVTVAKNMLLADSDGKVDVLTTTNDVTVNDKANLDGVKLNLGATDAKGDAINSVINFTTVAADVNIKLGDYFIDGDSGDTIKTTLNAATKSVELTTAKDVIKLAASHTNLIITSARKDDSIDFSAYNSSLTGSGATALAWDKAGSNTANNKLAFMSSTDADITQLDKDSFGGTSASFASASQSAVVAVSSTTDNKDLTAFYLVSGSDTEIQSATLIGTIDIETVSNDKLGIADATHIVTFLA